MTKNLNKIKAEYRRTQYLPSEHLVITVDGEPLDQILHNSYTNLNFSGLIPTLLDCLDDDEERKLVWDKIDSNAKIIPILMCPDDCDLWCTVIIVECEINDDIVKWERIGLDMTSKEDYSSEKVGSNIKWLDRILPMEFSREEYQNCINTFKKEL